MPLNVQKESESVSHSVVSNSLPPHDSSPAGFSVHGIFLARMLGWVAVSFTRGSSRPRDGPWVSCITGRFFTIWATGKPLNVQAEGQLEEQLTSLWHPQGHTLYLICFAFPIKSTSLIKAVNAKQPKSYTRLITNGNNPSPIPSHCWAIIFRANHSFGCLSWIWSITWCWEMLVAMAFS